MNNKCDHKAFRVKCVEEYHEGWDVFNDNIAFKVGEESMVSF